MHLRFDYMGAYYLGEEKHAQAVMIELGITYTHSTPQSVGDQFWFWNCKNIPKTLPEYITELNVDPMQCIGFGLSLDIAKQIKSMEGLKKC